MNNKNKRVEIYLDNSATTKPFPHVITKMRTVLLEDYGNPSSLHKKGIMAEQIMQQAREEIASFLHANPEEIIFTSGGTESNNLAIKGAARRNRRRGNHLITTRIEHPSVMNSFIDLEKEGFNVTYLGVDEKGFVDPESVAEALRKDTILVSVMHVNNEVGSIQPVNILSKIIKERSEEIYFHVDAVQSFGRIPINLSETKIDLLTISAHKIHGPKGIGALYVRKGVLLEPLFSGGDQERELRPGTENIAGISGLGEVTTLASSRMKENRKKLKELRGEFIRQFSSAFPDARINGPTDEERASHIVNVSFPGLKGEIIIHALEERGIYASTGSACHSRRPEPSHVLRAMGLKDNEISGALRFSFSPENNIEEIEVTITVLKEIISELQRFYR